jgi:hypothetical protein
MCFSATASFTTALVLVPVGVYCVKKSASLQKAYWLFALIPIFFGIQQFFEGLVWLSLESDDAGMAHSAAMGFIFFSHLFWLIWIPLSCYAVENNAIKRKIYLFLIVLGVVHGLSLYVPLLFHQDWLTVKMLNQSIKYKATLLHDEYIPIIGMNILYAMLTLVPLLLASDRYIKTFGAIIIISLAITSLFFDYAFISVWCFFAAVLSFYILIMIFQKSKLTEN